MANLNKIDLALNLYPLKSKYINHIKESCNSCKAFFPVLNAAIKYYKEYNIASLAISIKHSQFIAFFLEKAVI